MKILEIAAQLPLEAALAILALAAVVILSLLIRRGVIPPATVQRIARLPVVAPILAFLRSERVIAGLIAAGAEAVVMLWPELEPFRAELTLIIGALYAAFIATHTYEKIKGNEVAEPDPQTPVLGPFDELLRSRKFMAGLLGVVVSGLIALAPWLQPYQAELMGLVAAFVAAYMGVVAAEDGQVKSTLPKELRPVG